MARKIRVILIRLGSLCTYFLIAFAGIFPTVCLFEKLATDLKEATLPDLPYINVVRNFLIAAWDGVLSIAPAPPPDNVTLVILGILCAGTLYSGLDGFCEKGPTVAQVWDDEAFQED